MMDDLRLHGLVGGINGIPWFDKNNKVISKLPNDSASYNPVLVVDETTYIHKASIAAGVIYRVDPITKQIWKTVNNALSTATQFYKVNPADLSEVYHGEVVHANSGGYFSKGEYDWIVYNDILICRNASTKQFVFTDITPTGFGSPTSRSVTTVTNMTIVYFPDVDELIAVTDDTSGNQTYKINPSTKNITVVASHRARFITKNTFNNTYMLATPFGYFHITDTNLNIISTYYCPHGYGDAGKCIYNPNVEKTLVLSSLYSEGQIPAITMFDKNNNVLFENDYNPNLKWGYQGHGAYLGNYYYVSNEHSNRGLSKYDQNGNIVWKLTSAYGVELDTINRFVFSSSIAYAGNILQEAVVSGYQPIDEFGKIVLLNTDKDKTLYLSEDGDTSFEPYVSGDEVIWDSNTIIKPSDIAKLEYGLRIR